MKKKSLKSYIFKMGAIGIVVLILMSMIGIYYAATQSVTKSLQTVGEQTVNKILSDFDSDRYEAFLKQPTENEEYTYFINQLNSARKIHGVSYVYTLAVSDKQLQIIIDGNDDPVKLGSPTTGTTYSDTKEAFNGQLISSGIVKDPKFGDYISSFGPIKNSAGEVIGVLGVDSDPNLIKTVSNEILSQVLPISLLILVVFFGIIIIFFRMFLMEKLNMLMNLTQATKYIAEGRLTEAKDIINKDKNNDQTEIGQLYTSSKDMIDMLELCISGIQVANKNIHTQSELLNDVISGVKIQTEHITNSMDEISSATESEANLTSDLNDVMNEFENLYKVATVSGDNITDSSQKLLEEAKHSLSLMTHSKENTEEIYHIITNAVDEVHNLNQENMKVSSLVSLITDISEQTSLLALNASIEAARAGENGRGFAVVAQEVSKLSKEVSNSVNDINTIVNIITTNSLKMVNILQDGLTTVGTARDNIMNTSLKFDHMVNKISEIEDLAKHMHTQLQLVSEKEAIISKSISEIATISEENAACTQEVYASNHQVNSSVDSLAQSTAKLNDTASELSQITAQFKITKNT